MRAEKRTLPPYAAACCLAILMAMAPAVATAGINPPDKANLVEMGLRLTEAGAKLQAGDLDAAESKAAMVRELARSMPNDPNAKAALTRADAILAQINQQRDKQAATRKLYAVLLESDTAADRAEVEQTKTEQLYKLAADEYAAGNYELARKRLLRVLDLRKDHPKANAMLGIVERKIKERQDKEGQLDAKESWKRAFVAVDEAAIPTADILKYASDWDTRVARRTVPEQLVTGHTADWYETTSRELYKTISFDGRGIPLRDVIAYLRDLTGLTMMIAPDCTAAAEPVNIQMKDVSVRSALNSLCTFSNTHWAMADKMIIISTDPIQGEAFLTTYPLKDLIHKARDFKSATGRVGGLVADKKRGDLSTGKYEGDNQSEADRKKLAGESWARFVRKTIAPTTWHGSVEGGGSSQNTISFRNGRLVVTHTPEVHKQILELLESFRRARNIQVSILSRFIDMNKDFLDYIGIEFGGLGTDVGNLTGYNGSANRGDPNFNPNYMNPDAAGWPSNARGAGFRTTGTDVLGSRGIAGDPSLPPGLTTLDGVPLSNAAGQWEVRAGTTMSGAFEQTLGDPNKNFFYHDTSQPNDGLMLNYYHLSSFQVRAILEAVVKRRKGTILDAPRITCFNGQRANIVVTIEETYVRNLTEERQTEIAGLTHGVVFEIVPYVSSDQKYITIEMLPVVNKLLRWEDWVIEDVDTTDTGALRFTSTSIRLPYVSVRAIQTTVTVPDGGTMMIGGMAVSNEMHETVAVPFLRKIPLLKWLFSARGNHAMQTSLVILTRADILIQGDDAPRRSE